MTHSDILCRCRPGGLSRLHEGNLLHGVSTGGVCVGERLKGSREEVAPDVAL